MPGQGEQHNSAPSANPFEEIKPHVSEYTAAEIATLSSRLEKQLGPEYISSRPGAGGGKVHYLAADKCINLANEVFGFNGWSSSIQQVQIDFVDESQTTGKVSLGLSVIVRVTLRDGTFHEDIGYGHIENCKGKAPAFEKAKKEGTTDALKRALRNFGNLLGNCVYDKDYVARVTKLKIAPTKWDPENLHRHQDFAPVKREMPNHDLIQRQTLPPIKREFLSAGQDLHEDEFGSDDFEEVDFAVPQGDHPDEMSLDLSADLEDSMRQKCLPRKGHPLSTRNSPYEEVSRLLSPSAPSHPADMPQAEQAQAPRFLQPPQNHLVAAVGPVENHNTANLTITDTPSLKSNASEHEAPTGFFTARAAESLQNANGLPKGPAFNPHLESPSIRKTAGVDHSKSKPVNRDLVCPPVLPSPPSRGSCFVNPQTDKARKLGMPGAASPLQNRGSYKPPQMKRPADSGRSALGDVTGSSSINVPTFDVGEDVKRQRLGGEHVDDCAATINL